MFFHHQKSVYSHRYSYYVHAPGQYPEYLVGSCYPCLHGYSRNTQPGDGNSEKYSYQVFFKSSLISLCYLLLKTDIQKDNHLKYSFLIPLKITLVLYLRIVRGNDVTLWRCQASTTTCWTSIPRYFKSWEQVQVKVWKLNYLLLSQVKLIYVLHIEIIKNILFQVSGQGKKTKFPVSLYYHIYRWGVILG